MSLVDLFLKFHYLTTYRNIEFLNKIKFYSVLRLINKHLAFVVLKSVYLLTSNSLKNSLFPTKQIKSDIIVTVTSFPNRIKNLSLTLETILRQKLKPQQILVYLSSDQFTSKLHLPKSLLHLEKRGITFVFVEGDLKSHKKYFYAFQHFKENPILTIDDDLLYDSELILRANSFHLNTPGVIGAHYAYEIGFDENNCIQPYREWNFNKDLNVSSNFIFFGSGGGTLFPPNIFQDFVFNVNAIKEHCMYADDVWLNAMCRMHKIKVCQLASQPILNIPDRNKVTLTAINVGENLNDKQIIAVRHYCITNFNIDPFSLHYLLSY